MSRVRLKVADRLENGKGSEEYRLKKKKASQVILTKRCMVNCLQNILSMNEWNKVRMSE